MSDDIPCIICRKFNSISDLHLFSLCKTSKYSKVLGMGLCAEHAEQWTRASKGFELVGADVVPKNNVSGGRSSSPSPPPTFLDIDGWGKNGLVCSESDRRYARLLLRRWRRQGHS